MVIEERPPERVRAGATHPLGNRVHRGRRREQAFSHLHADHPPPTSQGHSCLCAECPLDTACGHMHRGCQLRHTAVVARPSTPGGRTSPRGPNEGLLRRSFPNNLPQKRLKAPATDDPHRIISNQDLNSHKLNAGGDLLSHTLPGAVPSAQAGLASGFGKGPGVTPPLKPPTNTTEQTTHTQPHQPAHNKSRANTQDGVPCRSRHCTMNANT